MSRYNFLRQEEVFEALNRLRDAFLAAKDGTEVELIIKGLLSHDEKLKIGRRILVARYLSQGYQIEEISSLLKVGKNTIASVNKSLIQFPGWINLLERRKRQVEEEYKQKAYKKTGGSTKVFKIKEQTGFKRKEVKR